MPLVVKITKFHLGKKTQLLFSTNQLEYNICWTFFVVCGHVKPFACPSVRPSVSQEGKGKKSGDENKNGVYLWSGILRKKCWDMP
jgi:hypothetical protein